MPLPDGSTSCASRMNRQVARSNICERLIDGLNDEFEVIERLQLAEAGRLHAAVDLPLLSDEQLVLEDQLQELGVVELVTGGLLQGDWARPESHSSCRADCKRSFIMVLLIRGRRGTIVGWSGETEPGSAEVQPGKG